MLMIAGPGRSETAARAARQRRAEPVSPAQRTDAVGARPARPEAPSGPQSEPQRPAVPPLARAFAPLVAHLIAGALGLPQTRARRRAEAQDATRIYRGGSGAARRAGALYEAKA